MRPTKEKDFSDFFVHRLEFTRSHLAVVYEDKDIEPGDLARTGGFQKVGPFADN